MNKSLIRIFIAASILTGSSAQVPASAQEDASDQARLCKVYYIESVLPPLRDGQCPPSTSVNEAGQCVMVTEASNVFSYIQQDNRDLRFGLSYWFGTGAHCGITGAAKYTGEGWRYESNMDSDNPQMRCALNIIPEDNAFLFRTDPDATCRMECGAQARLDGVRLPYDAVESHTVKPQDLEPETFYNTPCR